MDLNEYQKLAMRTSPDGHDRIKNGCLGLIGESGEIVDIVKKHMFQSKADTPLPVDKIIDEMGDVLWYCAEIATGMEKNLQSITGQKPAFSSFDAYTSGFDVDIETAAGVAAFFAARAYAAHRFDENCILLRSAVYDVYRSLLELCGLLDTTIEHVAEVNIEKLKKRYPDGFDPERSMNRPEYQHKEQIESAPGFLFNQRNKTV